jgi:hypothetical protein
MMTIIDRHSIWCDVSPILRDIALVIKAPTSKYSQGEVLHIASLHLFDDSFILHALVSFHVPTTFFLFCIFCRVLNCLSITNTTSKASKFLTFF